ncbi:NUDIX hydrolase [Paenibacillus puldeungensis]
MARAPFQILVFPYIKISETNSILYAVFRRSQEGYWQGIAGGGEEGETILDAAKREAFEEAEIPTSCKYKKLDSSSMLPVIDVVSDFLWGLDTYVVPEYSFGVEVGVKELLLSSEHKEFKWVTYEEAINILKWDSNKTAIWELNQRLLREDFSERE